MSPEYHRPAILAISAPEIDPVDQMWDGLVPFGRFFEKCFYCKKKISDDEEVFMYRFEIFLFDFFFLFLYICFRFFFENFRFSYRLVLDL